MLLTTLAFAFAQGIANVMDNLNYQVVGIMVVMLCLGGMAVILTVISAAVDAGLDGMSHRIVEIKQSPGSGYAAAGRAEIFASHRIRPSR